MAKTQMNNRISEMTEKQIYELQEVLGMSKTELLTVAIDRLYQAEVEMKKNDSSA